MSGAAEQTAFDPKSPSFEEDAKIMIQNIKISLANIMDALPLPPAASPTELRRLLKIDNKLAWKVSKLLEKADPFEAGQYIPGSAAIRGFIEAVSRKKVDPLLLQQARKDYQEFENLVHLHAGSRRAFDMMLAGQTSKGKNRVDLKHRKNAFEANSYILGIQANTYFKTFIVRPSSDPEWLDATVFTGFSEMARIRRNVPWRISRSYSVDDLGDVILSEDKTPVDPDLAAAKDPMALPLVKKFCSQPLPQFLPVETAKNVLNYRLASGPVGKTASFTLVTGETLHQIEPRYKHERYQQLSVIVPMKTPCKNLVADLIVHKDIFPEIDPLTVIYSDLFPGATVSRPLECDRLELPEKAEHIGTGLFAVRSPEIPKYHEIVQFAFAQNGLNGNDFEIIRVRMQYPPTPALMFIDQDLPEHP